MPIASWLPHYLCPTHSSDEKTPFKHLCSPNTTESFSKIPWCISLKPVFIRVHRQRGRGCGLLVFILPKTCAGGPLRRRVPYMHIRPAWTIFCSHVCEQTIAQSYCTSGCLYIVLSTDCRSAGSNERLHTACACAVSALSALVDYCPRVLVHLRTPSDDDFYITHNIAHPSGLAHMEIITKYIQWFSNLFLRTHCSAHFACLPNLHTRFRSSAH